MPQEKLAKRSKCHFTKPLFAKTKKREANLEERGEGCAILSLLGLIHSDPWHNYKLDLKKFFKAQLPEIGKNKNAQFEGSTS